MLLLRIYSNKKQEKVTMENNSLNSKTNLTNLINELMDMSQKVKVDSVEETAFANIITQFHHSDDIDEAIAGFEEAIFKNRLTLAFMKKKISQLIENKIAELALETSTLALQLNPNDRELQFLMIQACRLNENYSQALAILDTLKEDASPREVILILNEEAAIYRLMQNAENTFVTLRRLLTLDPHNEDALKEIWWAVEISKNYKESRKLHNAIVEKNPYSARAWYNLAHAEYYLHQYEKAIKSFEYAFIIDEKFDLAYRYCAEVCMLIGNYDQALKCYYDLMEHSTPDAEGLKSIGLCYEKLENLIKARKYYLLARNLDPMDDEIYFYLGNTYKSEAQWRLSANYYERAISLQDRNEDYFIALAESYEKCDESHKADLYFRRATEIGPEIPTPWVRYAEYYLNAGKPDDALEILLEAEEYTAGAEIYYCRAGILFQQGEKFDAMENLGEALQIDFDMHPKIFEYLPSLKGDRDIKAIIKYYEFG